MDNARVARLSFKKTYVEPILDGTKTSTLRKTTNLEPGDRVTLTCRWGDPPFAEATVTRVSEVRLDAVDFELAHAEGFDTPEALVKVLGELYPDQEQFVRIDFVVHAGD